AKSPAHWGAAPDVPAQSIHEPLTNTQFPGEGSASKATSGTSRCVPLGTLQPDWNGDRENTRLTPPPDPVQPVSEPYPPQAELRIFMPLLQVGVVPPTAIKCGELAGCVTLGTLSQELEGQSPSLLHDLPEFGPPAHVLHARLPLSPDAANQVCPIALAVMK